MSMHDGISSDFRAGVTIHRAPPSDWPKSSPHRIIALPCLPYCDHAYLRRIHLFLDM
jgi:hypothetical protein